MIHKSVSPLGLERIQAFEGFQAEGVELADGRWLYGFGHVAVDAPGKPVTRGEAAALLRADLAPAERAVNALVKQEITQSQFDALVSFAFSIGVGAFSKSEVLRRANEGEWAAAGCAMDAWRKSAVSGESEVVETLVRRRAQEKAMLVEAGGSAPSAWLKPELDYAAAILAAPVRMSAAARIVAYADQSGTSEEAAPLTLVRRITNSAAAGGWGRQAGLAALFLFGAALAGLGAFIYFGAAPIDADPHAALILLVPGLAAAGLSASQFMKRRAQTIA